MVGPAGALAAARRSSEAVRSHWAGRSWRAGAMYIRSLVSLLLCLAAGCTAPGDKPWTRWPSIDEPGLALHAVSGAELREQIRSADADVVVVNVWATWCATCREEFPDLLRLRADYGPRGVAVIFVSGDFPAQREDVVAMLEELGVAFPTYIKTGKDMEFIEALQPDWSGALPATFIFDDEGRTMDWWEGRADYDRFAAAVESAMPAAGGGR